MDISAAKKDKQYGYAAGATVANPLGQLIFVDTTNGSNTNDGHDPRRAKATVAGAKAVAETNDTIVVCDGGAVYTLRVNSGSVYASPGMEQAGANYLSITADFTTSTWASSATGGHEILTVSGMVRLQIIPEVVSKPGNDSVTALIGLGTESTQSGFLSLTTANSLATGNFWLATSDSQAAAFNKTSIVDKVVNDVDVGYTITTTATTAGSIKFHCWWLPLEDGAKVTAGAGGVLV